MNLVESDSGREFLLNRFNRRVESYRLHHEQNYRLYQPIRREEIRKQLEETSQLHKRWIEFQANRTVGKTKNDNLNSSSTSFAKKIKKKLPRSPETTSALPSNYGQPATNTSNKQLPQANQPALCQNFSSQNVYQNYDQSVSNNKSTLNADTDASVLFQTNPSTEAVFSDFGNKTMDNKVASFQINSNLTEHFPEAKNSEENHERVDEDKEEENLFDEDWNKFWESINRDGDMPKEFLQVLQENECDDPSALVGQSFLHEENIETLSNNVPAQSTSSTTKPFVPCGIKSSFPVQPGHHSNIGGFTEQGVIRNNPHFGDQNLFNPTSRMFCGLEGTFDGLPSYEDAVNERFNQPVAHFQSQYNTYNHRNPMYPSEAYRPTFVNQQQIFHQGQQTLNSRKQSNFINQNFAPCPVNNADVINNSLGYQPPNGFEDVYPKNFQTYGSGLRFSGSDYGSQTYWKMNTGYEFYAPQQTYMMENGVNDSQMAGYQATDRSSCNYWNCHGNSNGPYQKQGVMNAPFPQSDNFLQQQSNNFGGKHHSGLYSASGGNAACMADVQHGTSANISVDTELSMIEDIINKR